MKLEDLRAALAANDVLTLKGGRLTIATHAFDTAMASKLMEPLDAEGGIEIRNAKLRPDDNPDKVVVIGKAFVPLLQPAASADVEVSFELSGEDHPLGVTLCLRLPPGWQFRRSFPQLPAAFDGAGRPEGDQDRLSALDAVFALTDCDLLLATHEHYRTLAGGGQLAVQRGINIVGSWAPAGALGFVTHMVRGEAGGLVLFGQVIPGSTPLAKPKPDELPWDASPPLAGIHLEVPLASGFAFPPDSRAIQFTNLRLRSYTPLNGDWILDHADYAPATAYLGDIVVPAIRDTKIATVLAKVSPGRDDELVFACQFIDIQLDDMLKACEALVGGQDLRSLLPASITDAIGPIGPQSASMTLVRPEPTGDYQVASTQLRIGMGAGAKPWSMFGGLIQVAFESAKFAVVNPFDGKRRAAFSTLKGTVEFLGVKLAVQLETPSLYVSARQIGAARFDLKGYFDNVAKMPWPKFLPEQIELSDMTLKADPASAYSFSMSLGTDYKIVDGSKTYSLPTLGLAVSCQQLPDAEQRVRWQFQAATKAGEEAVPLFLLVERLAQGSGVTLSMPRAVRNAIAVESARLSYSAWNARTSFECRGRLVVGSVSLDCSFTIEHTPAGRDPLESPAKTHYGGQLLLAPDPSKQPLSFGLRFDRDGDATHCLAAYGDEAGRPVKIRDLAACVVPNEVSRLIPESLELSLRSALIAYSQAEPQPPEGAAPTTEPTVIFGIDVGARISLHDLPVVGGALPKDMAIGLESLRVILASTAVSEKSAEKFNALLPAGVSTLTRGKPGSGERAAAGGTDVLAKGFSVSAVLLFGEQSTHLALPVAEEGPATAAATTLPSPTPAPADPVASGQGAAASTKWFDVDKSLGPLTLRRIGLDYEASRVGVRFDASMQLSVLTFNLEGLGLTYPLGGSSDPSEIAKNICFTLDGMGLSLGNGPVEIGGSLARVSKLGAPLQLEGSLLIRTAPFTFSAMGSYADVGGAVSVMAFAVLLTELGDPTGTGAFVVTGLAFGFGLNRKLRLPLIEDVDRFPLVQAAMGKQDLKDLSVLPAKLREHVSPSIGNFWLAAGIKFNSFGMVDSFLLVSVSWGVEVEIGLLGLSRLTVPPMVQPDQAIAGAELSLRGVVRVTEGLIQFEARLTENSFIFSRNCRLTGGFAFCMWFKGPHEGDFVLSLGGYHPAFARPAHYPFVPRLGMQLQIGTELCIMGEAYFALTPLCVMAGGKLCATYKSGGVEAWFVAYADFLINWQPFYYQASIGITLGIALRLGAIAIRLELGVELRLQGPPFGGEARVSLWIISFTIPFGAYASAPSPLTARQFAQACLPAPKPSSVEHSPDVLSVRITGGLLREQEVKGESRCNRVVNAHQLTLVAQSVIPCTGFAGLAAGVAAATDCGILPMGKTTLHSVITVVAPGIEPQNVKVSAITGRVPRALWGKAHADGVVPAAALPNPDAADSGTMEVTLGIRIAAIPRLPVHPLPPMRLASLMSMQLKKTVDWGCPATPPERSVPRGGRTIFNTIASDDDDFTAGRSVVKRRRDILDCLRKHMPGDRDLNDPDLQMLKNTPDNFQVSQTEFWSVGSDL